MKANTTMAARLVEALQQVDLDSAQSFFVSNDEADKHPQLQAAMLELIQTERMRRDETEVAGYPLPAFDVWGPPATLSAGASLLGITEVAAMTGDPGLTNFAFRVLQFWYVGHAAGFAKGEL
ncbi:MAG: hypothetical protein H0T51_16935 [Pirellulales bacterium]|nr:hypothetical protein [Pirellulales bacterium]